jgi:hypothetical protein
MENTTSSIEQQNNQIIQEFFSPITNPMFMGLNYLKSTGQSMGLITKNDLELQIGIFAMMVIPFYLPYVVVNETVTRIGRIMGVIPEDKQFLFGPDSPEFIFLDSNLKKLQSSVEAAIIPLITPLMPISAALKAIEESIGLISADPRVIVDETNTDNIVIDEVDGVKVVIVDDKPVPPTVNIIDSNS